MNGLEMGRGRVRTGYSFLDSLMGIGTGIITLRSSHQWLLDLVVNMMVMNHRGGRMLYLHWVDYHKRFWSIDYDFILRTAKERGADVQGISEDLHFVRAFTRDNNEVRENWEMLKSFGELDLAVLDSVGELYEDDREGKPMTYAIGKFVQLCVRSNCVGIVLDRGGRRIHTYLAHVSSVIIEFDISDDIVVRLRKHPYLADVTLDVPRNGQHKLRRWLC